ncbi:hypothetical protein [Aliamphritea hakodatensis]|uniref:hypothetical protein n=1 Tax=Aliamphritea hakodatensis TaxID=2895352 RepID=UPI0022FD7666|nr:hypothetical protein [Aliamphritea hakodatensis]
MSAILLLPVGVHVPTGKVVAPDEVERGNACNCECVFCGAPLQARQGELIVEYFAHQAKAVDDENICPATVERCIFWMAKKVFDEGDTIALPDFQYTLENLVYRIKKSYDITEAKTLEYTLEYFPEINTANSEIRVKLKIRNHPLVVVISYVDRTPMLEESSIHVSLNVLVELLEGRSKGFKEAMSRILLQHTEAKKWIYHSRQRQEKCEQHFEGLVELEKLKAEEAAQARKAQQEQEWAEERQRAEERRKIRSVPVEIQRVQKEQALERVKERVSELVAVVEELYESGVLAGKRCETCLVTRNHNINKCEYCGDEQHEIFMLNKAALANLYSKYYCANYGSRSLKVLPVFSKFEFIE